MNKLDTKKLTEDILQNLIPSRTRGHLSIYDSEHHQWEHRGACSYFEIIRLAQAKIKTFPDVNQRFETIEGIKTLVVELRDTRGNMLRKWESISL